MTSHSQLLMFPLRRDDANRFSGALPYPLIGYRACDFKACHGSIFVNVDQQITQRSTRLPPGRTMWLPVWRMRAAMATNAEGEMATNAEGETMRGRGVMSDDLSEERIKDLALQVLADPPDDLRQPTVEHAFLADEVVRRRQILESRLTGEIEALNVAGERARLTRYLRLWGALVVGAVSLIFLAANLDAIVSTPTRDGWIAFGIASFLVVLSAAVVIQGILALLPALWAKRGARRIFRDAAGLQVAGVLREIINDRWAEESLWGVEFDAVSAPTMVGVNIENSVSSATYVELSTFITEHSTSAIGVAGPRGIGKSTLMEQLSSDRKMNCIGVRIPAPRRYEPVALIRIIHRAVATEVLWPGTEWLPQRRPQRIQNSAVAWALRWLFVIGGIVLWIYLWYRDDQSRTSYASESEGFGIRVDGTTIFLLVIGGMLLAFFALALWRGLIQLFTPDLPSSAVGSPASALARRELERLDYSTATQVKNAVSWKLGVVTASGEDQVSLTEREPTDADTIESLSWFLRELCGRTGKNIVVCIDELDKIDKSEDVVSVINGIKDLFHKPGVHVVVSVSTDAMHSFAARGVLVRDVFDSAFDTVFQVRRMNANESREVLWRRATNFPIPTMMFCHVWAGGHPRDLIRAARACVTLRAEMQHTLMLAEVVDAVVLRDVIDLLEAAAGKIEGAANSINDGQVQAELAETASAVRRTRPLGRDKIRDILILKELLVDSSGPLHERIRPLLAAGNLPVIDEITDESGMLIRVLNPYMRFAACVSEFFGRELTAVEWRSDETAEMILILAQVQSALSRHPDEADRAVERAEALLHPRVVSVT